MNNQPNGERNTVGRKQQVGCINALRRLALGSLKVLAVLTIIGFIYERVMIAGDALRYPMPGQLIDVNGSPMHLSCIGHGGPTVVFIGGAGALSYQDAPLQQAIGSDVRACIYDRAGYLWSAPRPEPRTAWQLMDELHTLLANAHEQHPYVLVGSSNGGIYARAFSYRYPGEVAGLVLIDSRLETQLGRGSSLPTWIFQAMGSVGLFRLFPGIICPEQACDPTNRQVIATFRGYASNLATYEREVHEGLDGATDQIALLTQRLGRQSVLGSIPLFILQANQAGVPLEAMDTDYRSFVEQYRAYLSNLSSDVRYRLVISGHGIAVEHKSIVVSAIKDVLTAARTGQPIRDSPELPD